MNENEKLRLALGIISGRIEIANLDAEKWRLLGYEPHQFSHYGTPDSVDVLERCEDVVLDAIQTRGLLC